MFGIDSAELLIIALVALVVIGPKDLPKVMRFIGNWVGQARGMARHFRSGLDTMMREAELEEMEKTWTAENERIMREHPQPPPDSEWGKPAPDQAAEPKPGPVPAARGAPPIPGIGAAPTAPPPGDAS